MNNLCVRDGGEQFRCSKESIFRHPFQQFSLGEIYTQYKSDSERIIPSVSVCGGNSTEEETEEHSREN